MKAKYSIFLMFVVMVFSLFLVAQDTKAPAATDNKAACACCGDHSSADMKSCCNDGKGCEMKDGKMACKKDCCKDMKMADGKSCCKDGKCEMAKGDKKCCGDSCKMKSKAS
jgi:hypothetical protein